MLFKHILERIAELVHQVAGQFNTGSNRLHLIEGIGSSGAEVALNCQDKLTTAGAANGVWVSAIETSPRLQDGFTGANHILVMRQMPAYDLIEDWQANPGNYAWIAQHLTDPEKLRRSLGSTDDVNEGVQGARDLGMLELQFYQSRRSSELWSFLRGGVHALKAFDGRYLSHCFADDGGDDVSLGNGQAMLNVNQVRYTGGGTGSGMGLWLAYARHHQLRREAGIRDYRINADLLLPGTCSHLEDQVRSNAATWADLIEVLAQYENAQPALEYGPLKISRSRPPYSVVTLFDVKNANGRGFTNEQVRQVAAEVWWQKSLGKVAEHYSSHLLVDVAPYLRHPYIASAAGACRWTIPVPEMVTAFSLVLAQRLVGKEYLLREVPTAEAWGQQQAQAFINQQGLRDLPRFFEKVKGKHLGFDLKPYERARLEELKLSLANYASRTVAEWEKALSGQVEELTGRLVAALDLQVVKLANDPKGGLWSAWHFLRGNEQEDNQGLIGQLRLERGRLNQQLALLNSQLAKHQQRTIIRRGWKHVNLSFQFPRRRLMKHQHTALNLKLAQVMLAAALAPLEKLLERANWWLAELAAWQATLKQLAQTLHQQEQELARYRAAQQEETVVVRNLLCPEDEQQILEQGMGKALPLASADLGWVWQDGKLVLQYQAPQSAGERLQSNHQITRWDIRSDEGISRLVEFAAIFWLHLAEELSIEAVLGKQGKSAQAVYQEMEVLAAPLISMDEIKQVKPIRKEIILGSEKGSSGFFSQVASRPDLAVVETGDRHNVTVLITWWGLSPLAVTQAESWQRAYDYLKAQGEQLHVFLLRSRRPSQRRRRQAKRQPLASAKVPELKQKER